jgi:hypothetical protein
MNLKISVHSETDTTSIELVSIEVQVNPALFLGVRQ